MNVIVPYILTKSTEVDALDSTHFSPTEVAAADRPEIVIPYFKKQGTKSEVAEIEPIVLAEGGKVFALNPIPL